MEPPALVETLALALRPTRGLRALYLSGSFGDGTADTFSDIDFLAVVEEGQTEAFAAAWTDALRSRETLVLLRAQGAAVRLVNAVTEQWLRLDLLAGGEGVLRGHGQNTLRVLHDPHALHADLPQAVPPPNLAQRLPYLVEEFLRVIGLAPVALGRGELVVCQSGVFHLRNLLTELLILEATARPRGALSLSRQLSSDQMKLLTALPLPTADRAAILASQKAHAAAFLPRARTMAAAQGVTWPDAFEAATRARWSSTLGTEF